MRQGPRIESPGTRARPTDTGMMSLQAPFSSGLRWSRNRRKTPKTQVLQSLRPRGLEPHLGGLAQSASVMQERRLLQDVSGDIATLLQPHGAGAAEMDTDQHARERVLARSIVHAVVGTRQRGIRTRSGRSCRGVLKRK